MKNIGSRTVVCLFTCLAWSQALAHAHLKKAAPAPDSIVAASPEAIQIEFSEKVEPALSVIDIVGPSGPVAVSGKTTVDPSSPNTLIVRPAQPLPPGSYEARWRAVGADSHSVKGAFKFQVRP